MTTIKTKILERVKKNDVVMIPKWKFVLHSSLGIFGIGFVFLVTVFVFSFILFLLSRYGFMYLPFFGFMATLHALQAIPLLLLFFTIALLIVIELLSRYYLFSFRRPLLVTLLFITSVVSVVSFVISEMPMHEYIRDYAKEHHLDQVAHMYERPTPFKDKGSLDVLRGEVVAIYGTKIKLLQFNGVTITAFASSTPSIRKSGFRVGDDVVIFGKVIGDDFEIVDMVSAPHSPLGRPFHERENYIKSSVVKEGSSPL